MIDSKTAHSKLDQTKNPRIGMKLIRGSFS